MNTNNNKRRDKTHFFVDQQWWDGFLERKGIDPSTLKMESVIVPIRPKKQGQCPSFKKLYIPDLDFRKSYGLTRASLIRMAEAGVSFNHREVKS